MVVCALRLHAADPGSGVLCGRACWGLGFGCAPPLLEEVLGCVCAHVPVPRGLVVNKMALDVFTLVVEKQNPQS